MISIALSTSFLHRLQAFSVVILRFICSLYPGNPLIHYISDPRYPGPVQPSNVPVQTVHTQATYVQQYPIGAGQILVEDHHPGVGQVYGGGMRPITTMFGADDV
uniref:Uncharacterized protein n=1 Tax=Quercus lobata TaxID=97700 RepID=A0A7N2LSN1_QUELO